jgi:catechol 2,3-dioxygenase-like lactoylglutathione lyase family enzyme
MTTPIDRSELEQGRARDPLVRASGLHHVVLETPDLDAAERFYGDFGLVPSARAGGALYLRAAGPAHHVLTLVQGPRARLASVALGVDAELDLRRLASLPGASPVEPTGEPGGGLRVRLSAPGGIVVDAVHGVEEVAPLARRAPVAFNAIGHAARVGATVRLPPAPSQIQRIGHAVLETTRPAALVLWLIRTLGMIVSDFQVLDGRPVVSFLRCDRGSTPSDHHTLAVAVGPREGLGHVAFEVADVDEIGRGAAWLRALGHRHAWGIGRHVLGSQLFDYWRAPDGAVVEHYADGDVFDASAPTGRLAFNGSNLAQWGPKPPRDFALPPLSLPLVVEAARAVATSDEISLPLLARTVRALSR